MLAKFKPFVAIFCLLLWMSPAQGQSERILTIGYYDFPPSIYTDEQGEVRGPLVELIKGMFARSGYGYHFKQLPIARLYSQLRDGSIDLWAGAPNKEELSEYVVNARQQLSVVALNLYHLPETPAPSLADDLHGKVLIMLNGFSYWPKTQDLLLEPSRGIIQLRTNNRMAAVELLLRKRGSYLLDYKVPAEDAFASMGVENMPYVPVERLPIVMVGSNKTPNIQAILDDLDNAYLAMVAAGEAVVLPE